MQKKRPLGGDDSKAKPAGGVKGTKIKPKYIKLKTPADVMAYVQRLINQLRRDNREIEQLGKITNLLNTWIAAHKDQIETEELKKLRAEIEELQEKMNRE